MPLPSVVTRVKKAAKWRLHAYLFHVLDPVFPDYRLVYTATDAQANVFNLFVKRVFCWALNRYINPAVGSQPTDHLMLVKLIRPNMPLHLNFCVIAKLKSHTLTPLFIHRRPLDPLINAL